MEGKQLSLFLCTVVSLIVTTLVVVARCLVRRSIKGFGIDDWTMLVGQMLFFSTCCVCLWGCHEGFGVKDVELTMEKLVNARHAAATFECVYLASLIFVKLSIGFALLRITTHRSIRHFLYFIMTLSSISGFICMVAILSMCQPLSATWTGMGKCAPPSVLKCVAIYLTVSACITDFSCSILPFFILWNLQMARRLKFTLAVVLSLGFLASAATVVRACYFDRFLARVDYVWGFSDLALWSVIEGLIGITIGSVPSLKPMFKRFKFLAITSSHRSNSKKASDYQHFDSYAMQSRNKGKNQTRVITVAEESDSVKELVTGANIVVSQEFRHEEEYEYHDRKPASSV